MNRLLLLTGLSFLVACTACQRGASSEIIVEAPLFDSVPVVVPVAAAVKETSGIADSKRNPGFLWVQEDSGNPPQLVLLKHDGTVQKKVYIRGAVNRDWEDMVLSGTELYIADIGDNNASYTDYTIYKFPEPGLATDTVNLAETIKFKYPDGAHDAEAFLVEPSTGSIYIITKRDAQSRIYKLAAPVSTQLPQTAVLVGSLLYNGVVSAALSADEKEIIVKTYVGLNLYKKAAADKIEEALQQPAKALPYKMEPQGEAVCFSAANNGYYTLSESFLGGAVGLYFYRRK